MEDKTGAGLKMEKEDKFDEFIKKLKKFINNKHQEFQCASHTHESILEEVDKLVEEYKDKSPSGNE